MVAIMMMVVVVVMTINWRDVSCGGAEVGCGSRCSRTRCSLTIANQQLHSAGRGAFVTYLGFITLSRVTRLMSCGGT